MRKRRQVGMCFLSLAACAGCVHAGFSIYWAFGGTWLLETVGAWAVQAARRGGPSVHGALAGIGLLKLIAALAPPVVEQYAAPRLRRWTRGVGWIGAVVLMIYGGVNTVIAALVLANVILPDRGYDSAAMMGHALLWDPLFFAWGTFLASGLAFTRATRFQSVRRAV